jgi:antitoxin component HigA of HigAB toxin-antitoxin module
MNIPPEVAPIETPMQYHTYMTELSVLMASDPGIDTPEGIWMMALIDAIEDYERKEWPDMFPDRPTPSE